jgi:hypothetical protein
MRLARGVLPSHDREVATGVTAASHAATRGAKKRTDRVVASFSAFPRE